ncbi:Clp protease N-terminal domain-containing protein [Streptomyces sp. NRRL F-5126]|uniref:Clp protease N-terminal domain-containing protein n=1 Tax=Streptomyces sp. NRRL F-5126 TaxID=1463857 RepID=UPI0004C541FF|nr:Clp protease N-terminal domain-containing protein [Streptomyces sp. NRRL F-5126]
MFEQFAGETRAAVSDALEEARLRGDRRIGTEHLLLGALSQQGAAAGTGLGVDAGAVREALRELDTEALAAVGVDARGADRPPIPSSRKHTPFTSSAKSVLSGALAEVRSQGARRITPAHLLLALLETKEPDPAADVLTRLGVDRAAARERLRRAA